MMSRMDIELFLEKARTFCEEWGDEIYEAEIEEIASAFKYFFLDDHNKVFSILEKYV